MMQRDAGVLLTKEDAYRALNQHWAGLAMQGLMSRGDISNEVAIVKTAWHIADMMEKEMRERDERLAGKNNGDV